MNKVYILLGGNIGSREKIFSEAKEIIRAELGEIITVSSIYETEPWGFSSEQPFLNQVILIQTIHSAMSTLTRLLLIEKKLGRKRISNHYVSRPIDLDILFYNDSIIHDEKLQVPHPRMHHRKFTLIPLNEIAPEKIHPVLKQTVSALKGKCTDPLNVNIYKPTC